MFQADLAFFFVLSFAISLLLLRARGVLVCAAIFPGAAFWLPGALLGNGVAVTLSTRLDERTFRYVIYAVAGLSGIIMAVMA